MSSKPKPPSKPPPETPMKTDDDASSSKNPPVADDLPIQTAVGVAKTPRGWVAFKIQVCGSKVLDQELLTPDPGAKSAALDAARVFFSRAFILGKGATA